MIKKDLKTYWHLICIKNQNNINMDNEKDDTHNFAVKLINKKYESGELLENEKIHGILETDFKINVYRKIRINIENIYTKYATRYGFSGFLKNDTDGFGWERFFDLVYDNITKNYDLGIIHENPVYYLNELERDNSS